jgi:hypothetical protein
MPMGLMEDSVAHMQRELYDRVLSMTQTAIADAREAKDIVKQKYCAEFFDVSVTTLKDWVRHGCPEIRLDSGMVMYSKQAVRAWLMTKEV